MSDLSDVGTVCLERALEALETEATALLTRFRPWPGLQEGQGSR